MITMYLGSNNTPIAGDVKDFLARHSSMPKTIKKTRDTSHISALCWMMIREFPWLGRGRDHT